VTKCPYKIIYPLVSDIGNQNNLARLSGEALQVVLDDAEAVLDNTAGVTLDSEAGGLDPLPAILSSCGTDN
jgi:hypothetical protein